MSGKDGARKFRKRPVGVAVLDALAGPPIPEGALVEAAPALADRLAEALRQLTSEPDALSYPKRDVYNEGPCENAEAPLWSEGGLYGRVGKEAARTLLAWRRKALKVLAEYDRERKGGRRG